MTNSTFSCQGQVQPPHVVKSNLTLKQNQSPESQDERFAPHNESRISKLKFPPQVFVNSSLDNYASMMQSHKRGDQNSEEFTELQNIRGSADLINTINSHVHHQLEQTSCSVLPYNHLSSLQIRQPEFEEDGTPLTPSNVMSSRVQYLKPQSEDRKPKHNSRQTD